MEAGNINNNLSYQVNLSNIAKEQKLQGQKSYSDSDVQKDKASEQIQQTDQVSIRTTLTAEQIRYIIEERSLARVESENYQYQQSQELFNEAGKQDFLAKIAEATDNSPEATASRIVEGITGYIFQAFKNQNPDMTEEDFAKFEELTMQGFEKGLNEAKDILEAMQSLSPEVSEGIDETESLVRDQLEAFYKSIREELQSSDNLEQKMEAE